MLVMYNWIVLEADRPVGRQCGHEPVSSVVGCRGGGAGLHIKFESGEARRRNTRLLEILCFSLQRRL